MSLRQYLNVAYTVLFEEYQRWGMNIFDATEALKEFAEGYTKPDRPEVVPVSGNDRAVAVQNTKALEELSKMLGVAN